MWWHFSHKGTSQQTRDFPYRIFTQPPTILISSSARNDRAAWPVSATQYCFRSNSDDTFEFYFIAIGVYITMDELQVELEELTSWLSRHDYIGTKIATGRATSDEYTGEINLMKLYSNRVREIRKELSSKVNTEI